MSIRYTDIENTGLPAVPHLNDESTERDDRHEFLSESVWSHRQETDQPTTRPRR
ncbi:MAG: hypothetical protein ABEJ67_02670 [Halanaeroarchaeum sp.]